MPQDNLSNTPAAARFRKAERFVDQHTRRIIAQTGGAPSGATPLAEIDPARVSTFAERMRREIGVSATAADDAATMAGYSR